MARIEPKLARDATARMIGTLDDALRKGSDRNVSREQLVRLDKAVSRIIDELDAFADARKHATAMAELLASREWTAPNATLAPIEEMGALETAIGQMVDDTNSLARRNREQYVRLGDLINRAGDLLIADPHDEGLLAKRHQWFIDAVHTGVGAIGAVDLATHGPLVDEATAAAAEAAAPVEPLKARVQHQLTCRFNVQAEVAYPHHDGRLINGTVISVMWDGARVHYQVMTKTGPRWFESDSLGEAFPDRAPHLAVVDNVTKPIDDIAARLGEFHRGTDLETRA